MTVSKHSDTKPWYKQPLVWLVIFFPAATVVAGLITLAIAIKTDDGVVVDDYYKKGKEINRVLTRDKKAASLGLIGQASYDPENDLLSLTIASSKGIAINDPVRLQLLHATRGNIDIDRDLSPSQPGTYTLKLPAPLAPGGWIVQVSTPEWRIHGRITLPGVNGTALQPL